MIAVLLRAGLLAGLLGALVWGVTTAWPRLTAPSVASARPQASVDPATTASQQAELTLARPPLSAYPETTKRPLFFEGRVLPQKKPPVAAPIAPVVAAVPPAPQQPVPKVTRPPEPPKLAADTVGIKLLGVLVARGQSRALIEATPQASEWMGVGSKVREWTIVSIGADRVSLRQGQQTATLELYSLSPTTPQQRTQ